MFLARELGPRAKCGLLGRSQRSDLWERFASRSYLSLFLFYAFHRRPAGPQRAACCSDMDN